MLRLAPVHVETPDTLAQALALLAAHGDKAKIVAGGTDALPNMKHGLHEPDVVVHIGRLAKHADLAGVDDTRLDDGTPALRIGALCTLHAVEHDAKVQRHAPGLARAASMVAGPQLRRMGTLGGNLALDTRCLYYNQTYFWREALGFCLKKDGTTCHVVAGGKKCVAAASNDTATMLICLDARVVLRSATGTRTVPLGELYVADGKKNTVLRADELLTDVIVPVRPARKEAYQKLRHRNAIDFPLLSVGAACELDDNDPARGKIARLAITISALGARPNQLDCRPFLGRGLDDGCVAELAALAHAKSAPLTNIADDPAWRREMVPVLVRRALDDIRGVRGPAQSAAC